jgi:hypothetical protein
MGWKAHDTDLLTVGRGVLKFDRWDDDNLPTGLRDLGNATEFTVTVEVTELEHFSSREGIKKKDKTINLQANGKGKFTLEEYDLQNLALMVLGKVSSPDTISILQAAGGQIVGELDFVSDNPAGPQFHVIIPKVKIKPAGDLPFIGADDWSKMAFEFSVEENAACVGWEYGRIIQIGES